MLRRAWETWKDFARDLGDYQSRLILTLFYFFILAPFGVAGRVFGDPLRLRGAERHSHWLERSDTGSEKLERARNQF